MAALPFLPVTSRGKSQQWQQRSTVAPLCLRKQRVRCRGPERLSEHWESSLAQQSSLGVQSWATQQSPLWDKNQTRWGGVIQTECFLASAKKTQQMCSQSKHSDLSPISCGISWHRIATVVAMPVSAEEEKAAPTTRPSAKLWRLSPTITIKASRGTPCPGNTKRVCVVKAHPQTMTISLSCQATNYKVQHVHLCVIVQFVLKELTLTWRAPCVCVFRRYFCTLQVIHWSLQEKDNYLQHRFLNLFNLLF